MWQTQIRRRYGALEGALPEGALRPPVGGSWREHYFALGSPGGERHWGRLAVAFGRHNGLTNECILFCMK